MELICKATETKTVCERWTWATKANVKIWERK